ncbi:hypothetical protein MP228_005488 [Amoeboaphelidium protococcarum]|nr:hypothetical protein MP228_005488 [Amoeboaphelidium protococcarum]
MMKKFSRCISGQSLAPLRHGSLKIQKTEQPKQLVPNKELVFGKFFTDHMLIADHDKERGWSDPKIVPYGKISLDPSACVFHYGMECFEGMKAYKDKQGQIRMFRPDMNMKRLKRSAARLTLPDFDGDQLLSCIKDLVKLEARHIPSERGYSLYIRPAMIATQESLGVGPSGRSKLFTICSPVGPYYRTGFNAVSLLANPANIRAWPGGVGDCKVGGNYAPSILTQSSAAKEGFQQVLWLFPIENGKDFQLTEVGTMNLFVVLKDKQSGQVELATPALDGTILPGVTRDSILKLAKQKDLKCHLKAPYDRSNLKVSERVITMSELLAASKEGRLMEMFGAGTAAIVSPVKQIRFDHNGKSQDLIIPLDPNNKEAQAGPFAKYFNDLIMGIQYGEVEHEFSSIVH